MDKELRKGIVQVLKTSGQTIGTGFLVAPRLVVTCAHVAAVAKGRINASVRLVLLETGQELSAEITKYWSSSQEKDVAVLQLEEQFTNSAPLKLGTDKNIDGHSFSTYGFPEKIAQEISSGIIVEGIILGDIADSSLLQLASRNITEGASGAPVVDTQTQRVVGIITARSGLDLREIERKVKGKKETIVFPTATGRLEELAFATPISILLEVCPILGTEDICPYRGLTAFTENDVRFFHGRDSLISNLVEGLRRSSGFLAVFGSSGSGKSSAIQAGLLPKLRQETIPDFKNCIILQFRPGSKPRRSLLDAFLELYTNIPDLDPDNDRFWPTIEANLRHSPCRCVVFIDQFEELFTSSNTEVQEDFTQALVRLTQIATVTLVLAIRSAFYKISTNSPLGELFQYSDSIHVSNKISDEELREAIAKPAEEVGLRIEPGLSDLIIRDLQATKTSNPLPLLEVTLERLWQIEHHNNLLTCDRYQSPEIGGVTGAVTQWAEGVWRRLGNQADRNLAKQIFLTLIRISPASEIPDTRRRMGVNELSNRGADAKRLRFVIKTLADSRLIVTDQAPETDEKTIEIIHEALFREWRWFSKEIAKNREILAKLSKIETEAEEWVSLGRPKDSSYLLTGKKFLEVKTLFSQAKVSNASLTISPGVNQFAQASQNTQRDNRLKTFASIASGIALALSLSGLVWTSYRQRIGESYIQNVKPGTLADSRYLYIIEPLLESTAKIAQNTNKTTEALTNYRQIFLYLSLLETRRQDAQDNLELLQREYQQIETFSEIVERDFVQLIRTERLPALESDLLSNQEMVWREISSIASNKSERFEKGALQITYSIIHDNFGVGADVGENAGVIDDGEELMIPCSLLEEIEKLWREHTNCGWFNTEDGNLYDDSNCLYVKSGNQGVTLTNVVFEGNLDAVAERIRFCFAL
ncbi:MAG: serine protease [Elainellaceae cyanobacterium]